MTDTPASPTGQPPDEEPLAPHLLAQSLADIDRAMAEIEAGQGLSIDEARRRALADLPRTSHQPRR